MSSHADRKGDGNDAHENKRARPPEEEFELWKKRAKAAEERAKAAEEETKRIKEEAVDRAKAAEDEKQRIKEEAEEETKRIKEEAERQVKAAREAAEEQAREAVQRAEADRRARLVQDQLRDGTYDATFDKVWDAIDVPHGNSDYKAMTRDNYPCYATCETDRKWKSHYHETVLCAKSAELVLALPGSRSNHSTDDKLDIWPVDVLRSKFHNRNNKSEFIQKEGASSDTLNESGSSDEAGSTPKSQIAHLVPHSPEKAALYHHVAIWVFGVNPRNRNKRDYVAKLIHGSKDQKSDEQKSPRRKPMIGLKHMICNKIRLCQQYPFFDERPCVIIVPVLSLEDAKNGRVRDIMQSS